MQKRKPRVINADERHPRVPVALEQAVGAWFVHNGRAYLVARAPAATFKDAVLDLVPSATLADDDIDLVARWWLLCGLVEARRPMTLYASREEALSDQVQLDRSTAAR